MAEFKYYIVLGYGKDYEGIDEWNNAFKKFGEVLKKYNMELLFWGGSCGTEEGIVYVLKGSITRACIYRAKELFV